MVIMLAYAINFPHCHVTHLRWRSPVLIRHVLISFLHSFFFFLLLPRANIRTRGNRGTRRRDRGTRRRNRGTRRRNRRTRGRNRGTGGDRGTGGNRGTRGDRWAWRNRSVDNRFCTANNMISKHMRTDIWLVNWIKYFSHS